MDTYRWQHNNAVVTRMYYAERTTQFMFGTAATLTSFELYFIYKNYFPEAARARIPKYWGFASVVTALSLYVLLKPLTSHEIKVQWRKRKNMGKFLWSVYHLEEDENDV